MMKKIPDELAKNLAKKFKTALTKYLADPNDTVQRLELIGLSNDIYQMAEHVNGGYEAGKDQIIPTIENALRTELKDIVVSDYEKQAMSTLINHLSRGPNDDYNDLHPQYMEDKNAVGVLDLVNNLFLINVDKMTLIASYFHESEASIRKELNSIQVEVNQENSSVLLGVYQQLKAVIDQHFGLSREDQIKNYPEFKKQVESIYQAEVTAHYPHFKEKLESILNIIYSIFKKILGTEGTISQEMRNMKEVLSKIKDKENKADFSASEHKIG